MHERRVDRLHERRLVEPGMAAVFAKNRLGHVGRERPPVDHERPDVLLGRDLGRDRVQHGRLRTAVAVQHDDVPEAVLGEPLEHLFDVRPIRSLGNLERAGIRLHASRDAVRDHRRDHRVHARRDRAGHRDRRRDVRAVVDHAVRFERAGREQDGRDARRDDLLELHPVDAVHLAGRDNVLWRRCLRIERKRDDQQRLEHLKPPVGLWIFWIVRAPRMSPQAERVQRARTTTATRRPRRPTSRQ